MINLMILLYAIIAPATVWSLLYSAMALPHERVYYIGVILLSSTFAHYFVIRFVARRAGGGFLAIVVPLIIPGWFTLSMFSPTFIRDGFTVYGTWIVLWAFSGLLAVLWNKAAKKPISKP